MDERLRAAHVQFVKHCKLHKIRNKGRVFSLKHMHCAGSKNYPSLAQKHCNAAEAVVLAKWLIGVTLAVACQEPNNEHAKLRAAVFVNFVAMRRAMTKQGLLLPHENKICELQEACYLFHSALNALAMEALSKGVLLWKVRPKVHRLDHICLDQAYRMNPLWISCYCDEDFVGKIKAMAVHASPRLLERQVLDRYSAFVCLRWQRRLQGVKSSKGR
ncbi:unnamed protein product [Durusdinium trenchii]|uniref:Uncharacterized protein n=2 Tax=Durusdinium trenchii TaxID=1381693 RepID=A0ABP0MRL1_9DINO